MPVLSIIALSFLILGLTAAATIALLPLGILQHQGWFPGSPEIPLWSLLLMGVVFGLVLLALGSEDRFRGRLWATGGSVLLVAGILLGVELFLIQARRPGAPGTISLWCLFGACTLLGVIGVYASVWANRKERQAEEERAQEMERQIEAGCSEEQMKRSLRFVRRHVRR